jgi:hypothetical protein
VDTILLKRNEGGKTKILNRIFWIKIEREPSDYELSFSDILTIFDTLRGVPGTDPKELTAGTSHSSFLDVAIILLIVSIEFIHLSKVKKISLNNRLFFPYN